MKLSRIIIDFERTPPFATVEFCSSEGFSVAPPLSLAAPLRVELGPVGPAVSVSGLVEFSRQAAQRDIARAAEAALEAL